MKAEELALLYTLVGGGCALGLLARRGLGAARVIDAGLLAAFWPLYGPFLLLADRRPERISTVVAPDALAPVAERVTRAESRIREIERLLSLPEFSEEAALEREAELRREGHAAAAESALGRAQNIKRLRALRDRFRRELDHVAELLVQARVQSELVRLSGSADPGERDVIAELASRVQGLDLMLAEDPQPSPAEVENSVRL